MSRIVRRSREEAEERRSWPAWLKTRGLDASGQVPRDPMACYSTGGHWTPKEDRPMHATLDGERSLCGVRNIETMRDTAFAEVTHHCARCERSIAKSGGR